MIKKSVLTLFALVVFWIAEVSFNTTNGSVRHAEPDNIQVPVNSLYQELKANAKSLPAEEVFTIALQGFTNLKTISNTVKKQILTIIDFSLPSTQKRLWVIDLKNRKVLFHDLVAHGKNSGSLYARKFSNIQSTYMSSLGFYLTGNTYQGKHGLSLVLNGMDKDFNDKARERAIVMHGANYVGNDFIRKYGRLGRSFGCPALSMDICRKVIETIRDGSCLFIYYPDKEFLAKSQVLNRTNQLFSGLQ